MGAVEAPLPLRMYSTTTAVVSTSTATRTRSRELLHSAIAMTMMTQNTDDISPDLIWRLLETAMACSTASTVMCNSHALPKAIIAMYSRSSWISCCCHNYYSCCTTCPAAESYHHMSYSYHILLVSCCHRNTC
jgi:hypothetical protein